MHEATTKLVSSIGGVSGLTKEQQHRRNDGEAKDSSPLRGWNYNVAHQGCQYPKADDQLVYAPQCSTQVCWCYLHSAFNIQLWLTLHSIQLNRCIL